MKYIDLTKGKRAIVDDEDFEFLSKWSWYYNGGYAVRGCPKRILMHRVVNNTPEHLYTDHINRDKLDNRKQNLRNVNNSLNQFNRETRRDNTSRYTGVWWAEALKKWRVQINYGGKRIYLGCFSNIQEAVRVRKEAEKAYGL